MMLTRHDEDRMFLGLLVVYLITIQGVIVTTKIYKIIKLFPQAH